MDCLHSGKKSDSAMQNFNWTSVAQEGVLSGEEAVVMESLIFKFFRMLFDLIGTVLFLGLVSAAILQVQQKAFEGRRAGLVNMLKVNQQLVGKSK